MTFDPDVWRAGLSPRQYRSSPKVKVMGQSGRSGNENFYLSGMCELKWRLSSYLFFIIFLLFVLYHLYVKHQLFSAR